MCEWATLCSSNRHPSASGQLYCLTDSPRAWTSGLISCGPLSMSVRTECLFPPIAASVLMHRRICSGSLTGSLVAVVWELSVFQHILAASNCLLGNWSAELELKCQALYVEREVEEIVWRSVKLYWCECLSYWNCVINVTACNYHQYYDIWLEDGECETSKGNGLWLYPKTAVSTCCRCKSQ